MRLIRSQRKIITVEISTLKLFFEVVSKTVGILAVRGFRLNLAELLLLFFANESPVL
jgi:hypothetical protein